MTLLHLFSAWLHLLSTRLYIHVKRSAASANTRPVINVKTVTLPLLLMLRLWLYPCEWPMLMSVVASAIAGVPASGATPVDTLCQRTRRAAEGDRTAGRLSASAAAVYRPAALWLLATHRAAGEATGADGQAQTGGEPRGMSSSWGLSDVTRASSSL